MHPQTPQEGPRQNTSPLAPQTLREGPRQGTSHLAPQTLQEGPRHRCVHVGATSQLHRMSARSRLVVIVFKRPGQGSSGKALLVTPSFAERCPLETSPREARAILHPRRHKKGLASAAWRWRDLASSSVMRTRTPHRSLPRHSTSHLAPQTLQEGPRQRCVALAPSCIFPGTRWHDVPQHLRTSERLHLVGDRAQTPWTWQPWRGPSCRLVFCKTVPSRNLS